MEYFFLILFLASLVFLVIGLFNPQKSMFWNPLEATRKKTAILYGCSALLSFGLMAAVLPEVETPAENAGETVITAKKESETKKIPDTASTTPPAQWTSSIELTEKLPGSDYAFPVTIENLQTKRVKGV